MKIRFLLAFVFLGTFSYAQEKNNSNTAPQPSAQVFESKQSVIIDGKTISLNAKAGTMELRDENNKPIALFGFTTYFKENPEKNRPIIFAYNGGPGSSSGCIWE
jgi:carboxypeptidase C (cathepsin A)